jgi:hypothetical protein
LEDSFCGLTLLARSDILEIKRSLKDDFVGRFYVRKPDGTCIKDLDIDDVKCACMNMSLLRTPVRTPIAKIMKLEIIMEVTN